MVFARWYGVSAEMDAFYYAIGIPTFLLVVGSSAIGSVLVPALAKVPREPGAGGAGALLGGAALWAGAGAVGLGVALAAVLPAILRQTSSFANETVDLTQQFAFELLPFLACVASSSALRAGVEIQGRFVWSTLSPAIRTVALLTAAGALRALGPQGLPLAMFAGMAVELCWLLAGLWATPLWPAVSVWPTTLAPALVRFAPVLIGETLVALNLVVDKIFAALLPPGSVSLLEYADRARVIPMTLFESSLLVVAFNAWATAPERDRGLEITRALRWVLLIAPPILGGLWIGRDVAVALLFERGAFLPEHTAPVALAFGVFLPGVMASMLAALGMKAHVLADRTMLVLALGVGAFALNAGLDALFLQFGIHGLAAATSLTSLVIAIVSLARLAPELPRVAWAGSGSVLVASAVAVLVVEMLGVHPGSLTDVNLWLAAIPFVGLLGFGLRSARAL